MSKGEATRKRIIIEAATLFNKKGVDGTSMQDVSTATGLEKGSLYVHFSSKEELAKEAFAYSIGCQKAQSVEDMDAEPSTIGKLKIHIRNVAFKPQFIGGCPLINVALYENNGETVLYEQAQNAMNDWVSFVRRLIQEGQSSGEILPSVDPEAFATMTICLLEGACLTSRLRNSNQALLVAEEHLSRYIDTFLLATPALEEITA